MSVKERSLKLTTLMWMVITGLAIIVNQQAIPETATIHKTKFKSHKNGIIATDTQSDAYSPENEANTHGRGLEFAASNEVLVRKQVSVNGSSWSVSKTSSDTGTFILIRNMSRFEDEESAIQFDFGDESIGLTGRQTKTLPCRFDDDGEPSSLELSVTTNAKAVIHRSEVQCGDVFYVEKLHETAGTDQPPTPVSGSSNNE